MPNNIIDDMLKNQAPVKEKKKGSKFIVFLIIFLIILLAIAGAVLYILKKQNNITPKDEFLQYLGNQNVSSVFGLEKFENFNSKLQSESAEATTEITGDVSSLLLSTKLDLSEMKVNVYSKNNPTSQKSSSDISILYKDNEILSLNALSDDKKIGIISNDIIIKYVGSKYSNLPDVLSKVSGSEIPVELNIEELKNSQISIPQIPNQIFAKYIDIINKKVPETAFSSKMIKLERNNGDIDVKEYSMKLTESQVVEIIDLMLRTLETDDELLDLILSQLDDKAPEIKELLKSEIESYINELYEETPDDSKIYVINVYGNNNITYKISIDLYGEKTFDIDYNYSDTINSVTITLLETESNSGYSLDIVRTTTDVTENIDFSINIIEESEIVGKVKLSSNLVNSRKFLYIEK